MDKRKTIVMLISFQLLILNIFILKHIGIEIILFDDVLVLLYILFIPGFIFLKIFDLEYIEEDKKILFSVGLSLFILMVIGLFLNFFLNIFNITHPLSFRNIFLSIYISVLILTSIYYLKDSTEDTTKEDLFSSIRKNITRYNFFYIFLFFYTVFSTLYLQYYGQNIFLIFSLLIMGISPFIITRDSNEINYPLIVYLLSLSLLLHATLSTKFLFGSDIFREYYFINTTYTNGLWDISINNSLNAMLSLTILGTIFHNLIDLSLTNILKIVYPIIFAFVPVGVYILGREKFNYKIGFLGSLFFIFFYLFYGEMIALARQQIAELFMILILLLIVGNSKGNKNHAIFLFIIFGLGLIFSHYGTYYLLLLVIILSIIIIKFFNLSVDNFTNPILTMKTILILIVMGYLWYVFIIPSPSNNLVMVGGNIINSIIGEVEQTASQQASLATGQGFFALTIWRKIKAIIQYIIQFLIIMGLFTLIFKSDNKDNLSFKSISVSGFIILILSIVMPYFASALNMTRVYHMMLIILSPLIVIGGLSIKGYIPSLIRFNQINKDIIYKTICVFLVFVLVFNTGLIYEIVDDTPVTTPVGLERAKDSENINLQLSLSYIYNPEENVYGAKWMGNNNERGSVVADGTLRTRLLYGYSNRPPTKPLKTDIKPLSENDLLFVSKLNKNSHMLMNGQELNYTELVSRENKIYTNNGCEIYGG